jgi:cardiolipin synthase
LTRGWYDLGLQVGGYFAQQLAASFDALYARADFRQRRFARTPKPIEQKIVSVAEGQIILTGPGHNPRFLKSILLNDLRQAKSIRIIAAYFLPLRPIRRALMRAARRGAQVQIIVASKSDVPWLLLACRRFYQVFLRAGVEIYEYEPQVLHAKLIVMDQVAYVGSANLDRRSFLANYELILRLTRKDVAAEAREIFESRLPYSRKVDAVSWKKSRSFWSKLKERWAFFFLARLDPGLSRRQLRNLR